MPESAECTFPRYECAITSIRLFNSWTIPIWVLSSLMYGWVETRKIFGKLHVVTPVPLIKEVLYNSMVQMSVRTGTPSTDKNELSSSKKILAYACHYQWQFVALKCNVNINVNVTFITLTPNSVQYNVLYIYTLYMYTCNRCAHWRTACNVTCKSAAHAHLHTCKTKLQGGGCWVEIAGPLQLHVK